MKKFSINNVKLVLAGVAMMGVVSSCDVTDLSPATLIPDDQAFATAARIESAVLGVYESAQRGSTLVQCKEAILSVLPTLSRVT